MKGPFLKILALCSMLSLALANELEITNENNKRQKCSGMYSKTDWGGSKDTYIDVALHSDKKDGWVAVVIFDYMHVRELGADIPKNDNKKYVCDEEAVAANLCEKDQIGTFILSKSADKKQMATQKIDLSDPKAMRFEVKKSGYYCVSTYPSDPETKYHTAAVFQNAFGDLAASEIPKLPFYGGAAIAYALVFILWMFQYVQHRADILPVQNYITAICGFLVVEMIVIWGYYDFVNNGAGKTGSLVYLILVSILNSFRNAFTFFLLLIVCMGYGVVKPSLGDVMWKCRALAGAHFVFAVIYTISSYTITPDNDNAGPFVLFAILPLSLTMTAFYLWILSSLTATVKFLEERKQMVKAQMYKNLWRILLASICVIFGFFFINSVIFARQSALEFITNNWKSRWFMLDGWLNVVYFVDFCLIAFIWRPTANNRRFAMSTQIAQDENEAQEFEIGSLRESLDEEERVGTNNTQEDDDAEVERIRSEFAPPAYDYHENSPVRTPSPSKLKQSQKQETTSTTAPAANEGSSTVFAVADEEDNWDEDIMSSDDEASESQRLTKPSRKDD